MVGLGFKPFQSAVLNLLANTAPVAWGAIGTPIVTLAAVSGLDQVTLSAMAGRQLPFVSILVPFWLVVTFVKMEGGTWKQAFEVWPATLVAGGSFAIMQWFASGTSELHLVTDVVAGVFSVVCTALFIRFVWQPKTRFLLRSERDALQRAGNRGAPASGASHEWKYKYGVGETLLAWAPWIILILCCALWGMPEFKAFLNNLFSGVKFKTPVLVIGQVLGLGFLTRYSGTDAVLGLAFTGAGVLYPFFAAYLGWLGVFLTGSDTASNALFGSLQRITAEQLGLNPILIVATNSTGGVMGKMIDAQSIMVA